MTTVKARVDSVMATEGFKAASVRLVADGFVGSLNMPFAKAPKVGTTYIITFQEDLGEVIDDLTSGSSTSES